MEKSIKESFPEWTKNNNKYKMCLTDDLDSLFSCILLQQIKGYEISYFYNFEKLYKSDTYEEGKIIGVDMDLVQYACWGNHVTSILNPRSANLNVIEDINTNTYFKKYAGSTVLEIISFYDYDISNLSEEAKMVLLCIDSTYLGYYSDYALFKNANKKYLCNVLELDELYELQQKHTKEEFIELQRKYKLKRKIKVDKKTGKLKTGIDLKNLSALFDLPLILPQNTFKKIKEYTTKGVEVEEYDSFVKKLNRQSCEIFSQAQTNKNYICLSYIKK